MGHKKKEDKVSSSESESSEQDSSSTSDSDTKEPSPKRSKKHLTKEKRSKGKECQQERSRWESPDGLSSRGKGKHSSQKQAVRYKTRRETGETSNKTDKYEREANSEDDRKRKDPDHEEHCNRNHSESHGQNRRREGEHDHGERRRQRRDSQFDERRRGEERIVDQRNSEVRSPRRNTDRRSPRRNSNGRSPKRNADGRSPRRNSDARSPRRNSDARPPRRDDRNRGFQERENGRDRGSNGRGRGNNRRQGGQRWRDEPRSSFDGSKGKSEPSPEWGRAEVKSEENGKPKEKEKPNFEPSGKLTEDANTVNGVVIKYTEPLEARKPKRRWRLYPFKGEKALPTLYVHRQSAFLMGRDRKVADIPLDHPSCSKQHAALQFRLISFTKETGLEGKRIRPYLIDLESANGTFVNDVKLEARRYHELLERDVIRFGFSSREYVILHEQSKDDALDDDVPFKDATQIKTEAE